MSNQDDYRTTVLTTVLAARALAQLPIVKMLRDIETAEIVGPLMDPTLFREKGEAMRQDKLLLQAALQFLEKIREALPDDFGLRARE